MTRKLHGKIRVGDEHGYRVGIRTVHQDVFLNLITLHLEHYCSLGKHSDKWLDMFYTSPVTSIECQSVSYTITAAGNVSNQVRAALWNNQLVQATRQSKPTPSTQRVQQRQYSPATAAAARPSVLSPRLAVREADWRRDQQSTPSVVDGDCAFWDRA